jgi:hypothetical protein
MELLEGKDLRRRMLESYSRDPKGWSFVISPSPGSGFFDATFSGPDGTWMLKMDSLFKPSPIVIGSQAESFPRKQEGPFPYGYRKLPPDLVLQIMGAAGGETRYDARKRLLSLLRSEPVVPEEGESYAQGPLILGAPKRTNLSDSQQEIDTRLASEMRRILRLRYPAYG